MKKYLLYILTFVCILDNNLWGSENFMDDLISNKTMSCYGNFTWNSETQTGICQSFSPTSSFDLISDYGAPLAVAGLSICLLEPTYRNLIKPIVVGFYNGISPYARMGYDKIYYEYWLKVPIIRHSQADMNDLAKVFQHSLTSSWIEKLKSLDASLVNNNWQKQPIVFKVNEPNTIIIDDNAPHKKHLIGYKYTGSNKGVYEISFITGWPDNIAIQNIYSLNSIFDKEEDYCVLQEKENINAENSVNLNDLNLISEEDNLNKERRKHRKYINKFLGSIEASSLLSLIMLTPTVNTYIDDMENNLYITLPKIEGSTLSSSYIKIQNKI